jgi:TolB-like protein
MSADAVLKSGGSFPDRLIREQLQKIFLCPAFYSSDILRNFLGYITEETLEGRSNTIKEYTIAVNVLNKPISFKPQHDAIVRIHAGRLRRALNSYYRNEGTDDKIEISVPKGSYVPVFGSKAITDLGLEENASRQKGYSESIKLVVMPFKTFETDKSRMAFTDNLGQQLSAEFSRFSDFSVISYYSSQQLSLKNQDIPELAAHFGAKFILTGNVQFESRRLRISVQLTETQSGTQVWTELYHFNYNTSNLFSLADRTVSAVIGALGDFNGVIMQQISRGPAGENSGKTFSNTRSWYYDFYTRFNEDAFKQAYAAMEEAVVKNPSNEIAWAFLGELSLLAFLFNQPTKENPLIQGLKCARTALKLNPLSQEAQITMGMANFFMNNRQAGIDGLEYALQLNTNAGGTMGVIGCLMISAGEYERGISLIRKSMDLNKSYPLIFHLFACIYYFKQKDYLLACQQAEKMCMPDLALNIILRISILSRLDKKAEANVLIASLRENPLNEIWISKEYLCRFFSDSKLIEQLYAGLKSVKIPVLTVA